jgi:hypothetical protein
MCEEMKALNECNHKGWLGFLEPFTVSARHYPAPLQEKTNAHPLPDLARRGVDRFGVPRW